MTHGPQDPKHKFIAVPDPRKGRKGVRWEDLWRRARAPALVGVCAALAVVSLLLYTSDRRTLRGSDESGDPERLDALRQQSLRLEAEFEALRQRKAELGEADVVLLEQALQAEEEYIAARGAVGTSNLRHQALRRRLHLLRAELLRQESLDAEEQALVLAKKDETAAVPLLRRAVACELEIEKRWEYSGLDDPGRRARLDTRLRRLESGPLWQEGRAAEASAERLFAEHRYAEAVTAFDRAIALETEFLAKYRDVRDAEFGRADKLAGRRETALSGEEWRKVQKLADAAAQSEKDGDWPAAAGAWQAVVEGFGRLLTDHPRSEYADRTRGAAYAARMNFARYHEDIVRARALRDLARAALRARQVDRALGLIGEAVVQFRRLDEAGTGVFGPADPEREELEFLADNEAAVRGILPTIDLRFAPLPGGSFRLFRTEVPQGLFAAVMGVNPSAVRREANPVDSVAYTDAEEFARRFGWLIGSRARLPTVQEYRDAFVAGGPPGPNQAWTAENTDGAAVRPTGTSTATSAGFHDLIGNVEEWAVETSAEVRAPVVGGSVADGLTRELPVKAAHKRDRSRARGFRIVVE
jgi:hypothetical protein